MTAVNSSETQLAEEEQNQKTSLYDVKCVKEPFDDWLRENKASKISSGEIKWIGIQSPFLREPTCDVATVQNEWTQLLNKPISFETIRDLALKHKDTAGKWIICLNNFNDDQINEIWSLVAENMITGKLGKICHFVKVNGYNDKRDWFVISAHNSDFLDKQLVFAIEKEFRKLGIKQNMYYKPDVFSHCQIYPNNQWNIYPTFYSSYWNKFEREYRIKERGERCSTIEVKMPGKSLSTSSKLTYDDLVEHRAYSNSLRGFWYNPKKSPMPIEDWLLTYKPSQDTGIILDKAIAWLTVISRTTKWKDPDTAKIQKAWKELIDSNEAISPATLQQLALKFNATSGNWIVIANAGEEVDQLWRLIATNIVNGKLGELCDAARVSTAINKRPGDTAHAILIQTSNYLDKNEVFEVQRELRNIGITSALSYKPFIYSVCRIYRGNPWQINHVIHEVPNVYSDF